MLESHTTSKRRGRGRDRCRAEAETRPEEQSSEKSSAEKTRADRRAEAWRRVQLIKSGPRNEGCLQLQYTVECSRRYCGNWASCSLSLPLQTWSRVSLDFLANRWTRGSCVCRQTWASCVSADWWARRSTYSPRTSRAPRGTSIGIADSIFTLILKSMPIEQSMLTSIISVKNFDSQTLIKLIIINLITFPCGIAQHECQFLQFGRPRVRTMRARVRDGRVGRVRAEAHRERSRALFAPVRRAHQSLRALRSRRRIHVELFTLRGKQRHALWRLWTFFEFQIVWHRFISSNVRTTSMQNSLVRVHQTNLSDLKSSQQISLHHPSSRLHWWIIWNMARLQMAHAMVWK